MAYFHSKLVRSRGGTRARLMRRVACETLEEMTSLQRAWPDHVTINWPPRGAKALKSRSLPMIWIDSVSTDILEGLGSSPVSESHILVLTWLLRAEFWRKNGGRESEGEAFLAINVRGALIQLLRSGDWIDDPSSQGMKSLNNRLEKIDLGRRSDLNFSSSQSPIQRYDRDFTVTEDLKSHVDEVPSGEMDWSAAYRDGSKAHREEILTSRPWMRSMLIETHGAP